MNPNDVMSFGSIITFKELYILRNTILLIAILGGAKPLLAGPKNKQSPIKKKTAALLDSVFEKSCSRQRSWNFSSNWLFWWSTRKAGWFSVKVYLPTIEVDGRFQLKCNSWISDK